jgi:hypothetical protein
MVKKTSELFHYNFGVKFQYSACEKVNRTTGWVIDYFLIG